MLKDLISNPRTAKKNLRDSEKTITKNNGFLHVDGAMRLNLRNIWTFIVNLVKAVTDLETQDANINNTLTEIQDTLESISDSIDTINTTLQSVESTLDAHETRISVLEGS